MLDTWHAFNTADSRLGSGACCTSLCTLCTSLFSPSTRPHGLMVANSPFWWQSLRSLTAVAGVESVHGITCGVVAVADVEL